MLKAIIVAVIVLCSASAYAYTTKDAYGVMVDSNSSYMTRDAYGVMTQTEAK